MKDIIGFFIAIGIAVLFFFLIAKLTDYEGRMTQYNKHMCISVYGKNEKCQ